MRSLHLIPAILLGFGSLAHAADRPDILIATMDDLGCGTAGTCGCRLAGAVV